MSIARIVEARLSERAHVVLIDPRLLPRVIAAHRGVLLSAAHARCYAIARDALARLPVDVPLELPPDGARPWLLLVAAARGHDADDGDPELCERITRAAFHALVHAELEQKERDGLLDDDAVQSRMRRIGAVELQEIRAAFRHDDLLLPPASDREVYAELCATYLELKEFAPALLVTTFPGLVEHPEIERILAEDVTVERLLRTPARTSEPAQRSMPPAQEVPSAPSDRTARGLLRGARRAESRRQLGRALLLAGEAAHAVAPLADEARALVEQLAHQLAHSLEGVLGGAPSADASERLRASLVLLATRRPRAARRGRAAEDRVLFALERAVRVAEEPGVIIDVSAWIRSLGRRAVVRPRDSARELQTARLLMQALEHARGSALAAAERATVTACLEEAAGRAELLVRAKLRPRLLDVLQGAGLAPSSGPEQQACDKLVEELLDQMIERGFSGLAQLRDAVSRNGAKLGDVSARDALLSGDALLRADAELEVVLDGIHRRGDVYVRGLQRASSLAFGSSVGRALCLWLLLPALGAFTVLEGARLLLGPLLHRFGVESFQPLTWESFTLTSALVLGLVHSEQARITGRQLLELLGVALAWIFFRLPRAFFRLPTVRRWLAQPLVQRAFRAGVVPAALAALVALLVPVPSAPLGPISGELLRIPTAFAVFLVVSLTMTSRIGWWLENVFVDRIAPTWQVLSRHWLPELVRLLGRAFARAMEAFDRTIRTVDDALRLRRKPSGGALVLAATVGLAWSVVAYVARLYVTLLVEPEINPLKHFPVVTVAHKLTLPFLPDMLRILEQGFGIFGSILGGTMAGVTAFLLPSVTGFLAWELKENYRLYRATRPRYVTPARLGPEGETMHALLVPGIHSGTLPKLYDRLRRAAQRQEAEGKGRAASTGGAGMAPELGRFRERLHALETYVRRFAERELLPALALHAGSPLAAITLERVDLSPSRIRLTLACLPLGDAACELTLEQSAGWIVARVSKSGFLRQLDDADARTVENALAVFYHRAEVSLVGEQLDAELGSDVRYEVVEQGLRVWLGEAGDTELLYALRRHRPKVVAPKVRRRGAAREVRSLDMKRVVFTHQQIAWGDWERAWEATRARAEVVPTLVSGPSLLPRDA